MKLDNVFAIPAFNPNAAEFGLFFIHLKLELLTQFPAPNDEK